jgi:hypothetical protein
MNKRLLNYASTLLLVSALIVMNSCNKDDDEKTVDTITDAGGLEFSLTWSTGGTEAEAISEADWDITVYDSNEDYVAGSAAFSTFETFTVEPTDMTNGTYNVELAGFDITAGGELTLVITGVNDNASFTYKRSFSATEGTFFNFVRITKEGNTYRIERL